MFVLWSYYIYMYISLKPVKDFLPQAGNQSLPQEDAGGLIAVSAVAAGGWMLIGISIVIVVSVFCKRRLRQKCPRYNYFNYCIGIGSIT